MAFPVEFVSPVSRSVPASRPPSAALERTFGEFSPGDRVRVHRAEHAEDVRERIDREAVEGDERLIRRAAPHEQLRRCLEGPDRTGQELQRAEDVLLTEARHASHLLGPQNDAAVVSRRY